MPSPRVPKEASESLHIIMGQLMEATRAASDGLKSLSAEVVQHARILAAATAKLEAIEERYEELNEIVRAVGNDDNLMASSHDHTAELRDLKARIAVLVADVKGLETDITTLNRSSTKELTARATLINVGKWLGWLVTTGVAVWAATK